MTSRFVSNSLSSDASKLIAVDPSGKLVAWRVSQAGNNVGSSRMYSFSNPSAVLKGAKSFVEFLDPRIAVLVGGCLAIILDVEHMLISTSTEANNQGDPSFLVQRAGLPCIASCVASAGGDLLIGASQGTIHRLTREGRIAASFRLGINETITAIRSAGGHTLIMGTDKGQVLIFDTNTSTTQSTWRSEGNPWSVSSIACDVRGNWFCATLTSGQKSKLVSGSTRTLLQIFESPVREGDIQRCEFVQLASKGLSIVATGPRSSISVYPLDLSSEPRTMNEGEGKLFDVCRSAQGEVLAVCGAGRPVQVLSGASLALVHQLVVE